MRLPLGYVPTAKAARCRLWETDLENLRPFHVEISRGLTYHWCLPWIRPTNSQTVLLCSVYYVGSGGETSVKGIQCIFPATQTATLSIVNRTCQ